MKQYFVYKNIYKFLIVFAFFLPIFFLNAQNIYELNNQIEEKNEAIKKIEQDIKKYQSQLDILSKEKKSLNSSIAEFDLIRKKISADISITQNKIDKTNLKLKNLNQDIGNKEYLIKNNLDVIKIDIKNTNELEKLNLIEIILSNKNFTDIWNDIDNMILVRERLKEHTSELQNIKIGLEDTRTETIDAKDELLKLKNELADRKKIQDQNISEKNKLLHQTKNSEANYQKILADELKKKSDFEKELREFESQLKFILDPSKLPAGGVLSWPLDSIFVTQEFGAKTGPHRTYTSGHSGVDFRARTPLPIKSMADGVVKGFGDTDQVCTGVSFGKWVFIEYNNGLSSTFGHLSLIKVSQGQKVKRGQIIGYTGGTGRVTAPHLHISLYASNAVKVDTIPSKSCPGKILRQPVAPTNAYLDPMYYLPPYFN